MVRFSNWLVDKDRFFLFKKKTNRMKQMFLIMETVVCNFIQIFWLILLCEPLEVSGGHCPEMLKYLKGDLFSLIKIQKPQNRGGGGNCL